MSCNKKQCEQINIPTVDTTNPCCTVTREDCVVAVRERVIPIEIQPGDGLDGIIDKILELLKNLENPEGDLYELTPIQNNMFSLLRNGNVVNTLDLSFLLDDTNLSRVISSSFDSTTSVATFTRNDGSIFTLDLNDLSGSVSSITGTQLGNSIAIHDDGDGTTVSINETVTSLSVNANILTYIKEDGSTDTVNLSLYLDDTNLARITSGTLDNNTGITTFTRDDNTTFTLDLSPLLGGMGGAFEVIDEGSGDGIVIAGRDTNNYGIVGLRALDFTTSTTASTTRGATGTNAIGMGLNTTASNDDTVAIGTVATSDAPNTITIGANATATAFSQGSISIGQGSFNNSNNGIAIGTSSNGGGGSSIALGFSTRTFGNSDIAMGNDATIRNAVSSVGRSIAMGYAVTVGGSRAIAIGSESVVDDFATNAVSIGQLSNAKAPSSVAIGTQNVAYSFGELSLGLYGTTYTPTSTTTYNSSDRLVNIGNGVGISNTSDAFTILKRGEIFAPSLTNSMIDNAGSRVLITKEWFNDNNSGGGTGALEALDEGNGVGYRIVGTDPSFYGNIGLGAKDLSVSLSASNTRGATGLYSFVANANNTADGIYASALNINNTASGDASLAVNSNNVVTAGSGLVAGAFNFSRSFGETSLGFYGTDYTPAGSNNSLTNGDRLFNIGNGLNSSNRSDAFVVRRNGEILAPSTTISDITNETTGKILVTREFLNNTAGLRVIGDGYRISNVNDGNYGQLGSEAVDLSISDSTVSGSTGSGGATGDRSVAMNTETTASGRHSLALGFITTASGDASVAGGQGSLASSSWAVAMGLESIASGFSSFSMGSNTEAKGNSSIALGSSTTAENGGELAIGSNNTIPANISVGIPFGATDIVKQRLFVVGDGKGLTTSPKSDIFSVFGNQGIVVHPKPANTTSHPDEQAGMIRFNSNTNKHQGYDGTQWNDLY